MSMSPTALPAGSASRSHAVTLLRDATLVLGTTISIAVFSNVLIPLPFTPVPISLATLAVLFSAAALGPVRAGLGASLFAAAGIAGIPWFAAQGSGWNFPSFGYVIGYTIAAVVVGHLMRSWAQNSELRTVAAMAAGSVTVYAIGAPWLMVSLGVDWTRAAMMGVVPFLIGDALKVLIAAGSVSALHHLRPGLLGR